ncbi:MAG: electron transport complex subunit RsxG [Gallionellales bacterium CG_4_10_14_3_um_filter_54_96]|nr:electron transport complex subunit RsxG [Gallionella sp.]OIO75710.1 MAG: electron transporter RnfG [Gallionellaceae bacterium CG1_02_56_997]PIV15221.1 MAG: electron transport complex subunit RsxG [Gallionellales bacterium CG03_land_8_20_14_0_80_55_15]PIX04867.1 MAG: electron transport complex subunit RsxG [Gallionellales bacterium CG_4_8_14_3_um_filter_54_18]PIY07051.1 MAG: electron transport complex subunit RsxG [Gallionellales bacterium CG_4_10_14_3_um_filter_54_96]
MRRTLAKASLHSALNLLFFAVLGTIVLSSTYLLTRDTIAQSVETEKLKLIAQIVPQDSYDNNIVQSTLDLPPDELLGTEETSIGYRATLKGEPSVVVLQPVAPDGYSGKIFLIVAIRSNGEVSGVRVVSHHETPGLGDYIEVAKNPWIKQFDGQSLTNHTAQDWQVKKDGGKFDSMAGATITPRAVVKAVHKAVQYFAKHRDQLLTQAPPSSPDKSGREGVKEKTK